MLLWVGGSHRFGKASCEEVNSVRSSEVNLFSTLVGNSGLSIVIYEGQPECGPVMFGGNRLGLPYRSCIIVSHHSSVRFG